jgi:dimethylargininase
MLTNMPNQASEARLAGGTALTRAVSPTIVACELTHLPRSPIDPARAAEQHGEYERVLESLGMTVQRVEPAPQLPDAVFIEDTAIVLPELAIVTRPGAKSRRAETAAVAKALEAYRTVVHLRDALSGAAELSGTTAGTYPTLDGGDVLVIGHTLFVGGSQRSNDAGRIALQRLVRPYGYEVVRVEMRDCLHLKSAASLVAEDTILLNPAWVDAEVFGVSRVIDVAYDEPFAGNALWIDKGVIHDVAYKKTRARLEAEGISVYTVDASELGKAEGGVTCCSIIVDGGPQPQ